MDMIPRNDYGERCQFDAYCKLVLYHEASTLLNTGTPTSAFTLTTAFQEQPLLGLDSDREKAGRVNPDKPICLCSAKRGLIEVVIAAPVFEI